MDKLGVASISSIPIDRAKLGRLLWDNREGGLAMVFFKSNSLSFVLPALLMGLLISCSGRQADSPPSPASVQAKELADHTAEFKQEIIRVADGVYVAVGYGIANSILVEGKDGTVIIDTLESAEAAKAVMQAFEKITTKPLKAVLFTHFHPDHTFIEKSYAPAADITVTVDSKIWKRPAAKIDNPAAAYALGKVKVKGAVVAWSSS